MSTTLLLTLAIFSLSICSSATGTLQVLYVVPTAPTTKCPPGNSPCHSLQYYANHSSFTVANNSEFRFLEGDHHLNNTAVNISNVANLSLVGENQKVNLLCYRMPSQYAVMAESFVSLSIKNFSIRDCKLLLTTGSGLSISRTTFSYISDPQAAYVKYYGIIINFQFYVIYATRL